MDTNWHFSGYATRNDLLCSDGRTIRKNAFKECDGTTVPLIWNHDHTNQDAVLGHALLENREDGVYAYCTCNDTEQGELAKKLVANGDVRSLSIYANKLKQIGGDVIHGAIRELSLVLAGANEGAYIDYVIAHSDEEGDSMYANYDTTAFTLNHSLSEEEEEPEMNEEMIEQIDDEEDETVGDVFNTLTEKQKIVVYQLLEDALTNDEDEGDDAEMKHNVFDNEDVNENVLTHSDMEEIIRDGKKYGSLKESFLAHADTYGIQDLEDYLFPEARELNNIPEFIKRETGWVQKVIAKVHKSPFSRIKTRFADITEDEARAKGYIKGRLKKEEVFSLLKRSTQPTTIYKKQKMDRDDVIDITDFDVISWLKAEMRMMLDEEIARALLVGDGRLASSDDHIDENCIRPIINDADLFVIRWTVGGADADAKAKNFIKACIKSRKNYKGSGNPTLYTTEDMLTDMLLLEDTIGHRLYKTEAELATTLRVSEIITVPVMENCTDKFGKPVLGVIANLVDYSLGADKGGSVNMFEDFDIDYNQQKYLIETRCSGSLVKPFSAIVIRDDAEATGANSDEPTKAAAMAEFKN